MPSSTTPLRAKLVLAAIATLVSGAVAYVCYTKIVGTRGESVEIVDRRSEVAELLAQRAAEATPSQPVASPAAELTATRQFDLPSLDREDLPVETARFFFPLSGFLRPYNPKFFFARPPNVFWDVEWPEHPNGTYETRTNEIGIREDVPVRAEKPNLRVIVTGDSHTDGVCANSESFPNCLERRLAAKDPERSVEVLNMGIGGYTFWNYLGVIEHWAPILKPDVFVIACYGGNDFYELLGLERYFHKRKAGSSARLPQALLELENTGMISQEFMQTGMLLSNPEDVKIATDTANSITHEILSIAQQHQCAVIAVYIPPPTVGRPEEVREELDRILPLTDWKPEELDISSRIADDWLAFARSRGVTCLDLRPLFQASNERLYWQADRHINLVANELIAKELEPLIEAVAKKP